MILPGTLVAAGEPLDREPCAGASSPVSHGAHGFGMLALLGWDQAIPGPGVVLYFLLVDREVVAPGKDWHE